ncbi:peptidoglycan endopeptidase [Sphingobium yanoikuyae]|uniref:Peptidoglycan endopeptidase n=1 Tax=Sphingobium yanoikuyae TaxID=13690 RepID=A0A6P1GIC7_SPHYA|nr:peptidoglycan endopeptidase [Sphingobium yanoikuyae]QHD67852.1 peptidoglycan endopeptidase [Sphingobium yanoikuyae]
MSGPRSGAAIAAAARALVGVPFRLQGRDPALGLDCVGLVGAAMRAAGYAPMMPGDYGLRFGDDRRADEWARAAGLRPVRTGAVGDMMLVRPGALHRHLLILVPGGFVHAHAGLRRVVETPGAPPWPVLRIWRA